MILDRIPRSSLQSARVKATGPGRLEKAAVQGKMKGGRVLDLFKGQNEAELKRERVESKKIKYLLDLIEKRDDNTKQSRYYEDLFEYSDNIKQFVKRL